MFSPFLLELVISLWFRSRLAGSVDINLTACTWGLTGAPTVSAAIPWHLYEASNLINVYLGTLLLG